MLGEHLDADIVVTATGLVLKLMSGLQLTVNTAPVDLSKTITYKGMMYSDVPNLASAFGYTNLIFFRFAFIRVNPRPILRLQLRLGAAGAPHPPATGSKAPWRLHQNYIKEFSMLRFGRVDDGTIEFNAAPVGRNAEAGMSQQG